MDTTDQTSREIGDLIAAFRALRKPGRLQAAEAALRVARRDCANGEQRLSDALAADREVRDGALRPSATVVRLAAEVNAGEERVRAAREARDAQRCAAHPDWVARLAELELRAASVLRGHLNEMEALLEAIAAAQAFMREQRVSAPPLTDAAPRLLACLRPITRLLGAPPFSARRLAPDASDGVTR